MRHSLISYFKSLFFSKIGFCFCIALLMVILRMAFFDYHTFFQFQSIPNHDMYQGASFFATSMHSIRLEGDIVWWNPASNNGYAQYYQHFLSPLAPTPHHIVFISWAQAIRLLSYLDISLPEYFQYLIINYLVLPFLAFFMFSIFCSLIFRYRSTIFLILLVYTFSGIGLWNSAWFYFQESFTLFLLLSTVIALLQRPSLSRLSLFLAALLIQIVSFNYWTIYNSWFIIILLGVYCGIYLKQIQRLLLWGKTVIRQYRGFTMTLFTGLVVLIALWGVIIGSIAIEQSGNFIRNKGEMNSSSYSIESAYVRIQEMRRFTTELFNPNIHSVLQSYKIINEMHNARYIGAFLLPLLLLIPFSQWHDRERWLISSAIGILIVCLAPPILLGTWKLIPFMDRILHLFYFYTHYWQLIVVLLAGNSMETLLRHDYNNTVKRCFQIVMASFIGLLLLSITTLFLRSQDFPANDPHLQGNLHFILVTLITSIFILRMLLFSTYSNRRAFVVIILILAFTDMTRYFWEVSVLDRNFTQFERFQPNPQIAITSKIQKRLLSPWSVPNIMKGFQSDIFQNMPIKNKFWPNNIYMTHRYWIELQESSKEFSKELKREGKSLAFYTHSTSETTNLEQLLNQETLLLHNNTSQVFDNLNAVSLPSNSTNFIYKWDEWNYNSFSFEINAPQIGWLFIRQLYDSLWKITINGKPIQAIRANFVGMAIPITEEGKHSIRMEYRPLARSLYKLGCALLEVMLIALLVIAFYTKKRQPLIFD